MSNVRRENEGCLECLDSCFSIPRGRDHGGECCIFGLPPVSEIPAVLKHLCLTTTVNNKVIPESICCAFWSNIRTGSMGPVTVLNIVIACTKKYNIMLLTSCYSVFVCFFELRIKNMQPKLSIGTNLLVYHWLTDVSIRGKMAACVEVIKVLSCAC